MAGALSYEKRLVFLIYDTRWRLTRATRLTLGSSS